MIYACVFSALCGAILGLIWAKVDFDRCIAKFWAMINELEADKRALTESLCRANGTPYVRASWDKHPLQPSSGWYDAPDIVKQPEQNR